MTQPLLTGTWEVPRLWGGRYRLERLLGAGGMGAVYCARDLLQEQLGDPYADVALKILNDELAHAPDANALLFNEFALMRQVRHPNLVHLYSFGIDPEHDRGFIVMELLRGPTLDRVLCERPLGLPLHELQEIGLPLLSVLAHAHQHGVLHGDIKPGNVLLSEQGVRLFDFGLGQSEAGQLQGLASLSRTRFNAWTPGYAAPELRHGGPLTRQAELYSVGCLLHELATGKPPFNPRIPALSEYPPQRSPHKKPRHLPSQFWSALQTAIKQDPKQRTVSIEQLIEALKPAKKRWCFKRGT